MPFNRNRLAKSFAWPALDVSMCVAISGIAPAKVIVKLGAWFVVVVVFDLFFEHFDNHFALGGLPFANRRSAVILEEIGKLEFGNAQHLRFEGTAN